MFSFPILMTPEIWLIFHVLTSFIVFITAFFTASFVQAECYGKAPIEDLASVKQRNFLYIGLPILAIFCALYMYYISNFFYLNYSKYLSSFIFFLSSASCYLCAAYCGTWLLDPRWIDSDMTRIKKKCEIHGIGTLKNAVTLGDSGTPLLAFLREILYVSPMRIEVL